ncbi:MAG TPA: hypothetical protein VFK06_00575 [Candidatus Angelobacter sp.]|nr:hypothetical protein [Candidatus Angelobacter sp.]
MERDEEQKPTGIASESEFSLVFLSDECFFDVVQWRRRLPGMASSAYQPELDTHPAREGRAMGVLGQLHWTTAAKATPEVWLPGELLQELWWFRGGFAGNQSGPDLGCVPFVFMNGSRKWIALQCGRA